ncbi:MAG: hypothetical protein M3P48_04700, partial [Actinomycetota bacterium]|nr:hypothetical protein [Actinomycetota bacterium]
MAEPRSLPSREVATGWIGQPIDDTDGVTIGTCTAVFADDATGVVEWLAVELSGGRRSVIPAHRAQESGGSVRVPLSRDAVASAPEMGGTAHLDRDDEVRLYDHYGIAYSDDASPTLLPVDAAPTGTETPPLGTLTTGTAASPPAATTPA